MIVCENVKSSVKRTIMNDINIKQPNYLQVDCRFCLFSSLLLDPPPEQPRRLLLNIAFPDVNKSSKFLASFYSIFRRILTYVDSLSFSPFKFAANINR